MKPSSFEAFVQAMTSSEKTTVWAHTKRTSMETVLVAKTSYPATERELPLANWVKQMSDITAVKVVISAQMARL